MNFPNFTRDINLQIQKLQKLQTGQTQRNNAKTH